MGGPKRALGEALPLRGARKQGKKLLLEKNSGRWGGRIFWSGKGRSFLNKGKVGGKGDAR